MRLLLVAGTVFFVACGPGRDGGAHPLAPAGKTAGEACSAGADCRSDLVCVSGACASSPPPSPSTSSLPPPQLRADPGVVNAIEPGPGFCVSTIRAPALPPEMVQDLGELQVGSTASFEVPAGTSTFTIFAQEAPPGAVDTISLFDPSSGTTFVIPNSVVPTDVKTPAGALFFDDLAPWPIDPAGFVDATGANAYYAGATPVSGAFTVPDTSAGVDRVRSSGQLAAGTWTFVANDWARECTVIAGCSGGDTAGRYHVHAVTKPGPVASTGALDVEVYLLTDPSSPIATAAAAAADPQIARWVTSLAYYLARAGIGLGDVTFHDLPAWVRDRYGPNGSVDIRAESPCDPLQQLFATAIVPRRAVHLFLVEELVSDPQGGAIAVGVDGSIPGPSGFPGTVFGGAAVGLFGELGVGSCSETGPPRLSACGTDRIAYVAAHEVGHWLGLYHTTEATGDFFDPLSDTPRCPRSTCAPGAQVVSGAACTASASCGGGSNLMFWLLDVARSTGELSRDQAQLVRLNPAVR